MYYYCDVSGKTIQIESKNKHLQSHTHNKLEDCIETKHTIENPLFFDIDAIFNEYITNHNENLNLFLVKYHFKLVSGDEFYPHIKCELVYNRTIFHLKKFLLNWVEFFFERGYKLSHFYEINDTTISIKRWMIYEYFIKKPMQMVELKLNMIIY